jgi:hypothetical protein
MQPRSKKAKRRSTKNKELTQPLVSDADTQDNRRYSPQPSLPINISPAPNNGDAQNLISISGGRTTIQPDGTIETNGGHVLISQSPKRPELVANASPDSPFALPPSFLSVQPPPYFHTPSRSLSTPNLTAQNTEQKTQEPRLVIQDEEVEENPSPLLQADVETSSSWVKQISSVVAKGTISMVASGANAINAMMSASNNPPSDIGPDWWNSMSTGIKVLSLWDGFASLSVNYVFSYKSIPEAYTKVKKSLFKKNQTGKEMVINGVTVFLGVSAAVATSSIAFTSFEWAGTSIAAPITAATFSIYLTTRYCGVKNLMNRARAFFDPEMKELSETIDLLKRIREVDKPEMNKLLLKAFNENGQAFDDETFTTFFLEFAEALESHPHYFMHEKTSAKQKLEYASTMMRLAFAAVIGVAAFPTFTQKGFDGINKLSQLTADKDLSDMDDIYKIMIGVFPGLASAMLYAISAYDLPKLTVDILGDLWERCKTLSGIENHQEKRKLQMTLALRATLFTYIIGANYSASGSMFIVAESVDNGAMPIFKFSDKLKSIHEVLNQIGGWLVNTISNEKALIRPNKAAPKLHDLISILSHHRDIDHKLTVEAADAAQRALSASRAESNLDKPRLERNVSASSSRLSFFTTLEEGNTAQTRREPLLTAGQTRRPSSR